MSKAVLSERATLLLQRYPKATYLGTAPLFLEPRAMPGTSNDWVLVPAIGDPQVKLRQLHSPRSAQVAVRKLAQSGAPVSVFYIAHEVPVGAAERMKKGGLESELATDPSAQNATLARKFDKVGRAITKVLVPVVTAPIAVAAAVGSTMLAGLDPAVIAAVADSDTPRVGDPAAFFHIVSWI